MLLELKINNFAIIDDIKIEFTRGLNIISGETGAGKSILIDAIGIILGDRVSKDFIQKGKERAYLEGAFYLEDFSKLEAPLRASGVDYDDNILIISKEINRSGPSISRVNGKIVTLSMLNDITKYLVDIFGQHDHQSLLDISNHIKIVDSFLDRESIQLKKEIEILHSRLSREYKSLEDLNLDSSQRDREIDILKYEINEINQGNLENLDEKSLMAEYKLAKNSQQILKAISDFDSFINTENFEKLGALDQIRKSLASLSGIRSMDNNLEDYSKRLESILFELEDLSRDLLNYLSGQDISQEEIYNLELKIDGLNKLKNKYGSSKEEILSYRDLMEAKLDKLLNLEDEVKAIEDKIEKISEDLEEKSSSLSVARRKVAKDIELMIQEELKDLNMDNVKFSIDISRTRSYTQNGFDQIEFLISTNLGEDLKSLNKIASGGEMSRIMLAFKSVSTYFEYIPTMIFDEIDIGISGKAAQLVGEKIYKVSKDHQVICISHLSQITSFADSHYLIRKETLENRVVTSLSKLDYEERLIETARILSGSDLTETTMNHARELLMKCENRKKSL